MKIGIDFGTSFSLPAAVINGNAATLLPSGEYGIPSVFYYDSGVGVQVGKPAVDNEEYAPLNTVRDVKMLINQHDDYFCADGRRFTRKEIVGHIFKEIYRVADEEIERRQLDTSKIEGAIISVPAAFNMRELNFIREAAEENTDLKVLGFIREPVAAAISYFNAPTAEDQKTILVYDLGGGTCDVAIVRADKNSDEWYTVLDSEMKRIGGRDWDKILVELIKRKFREKNSNVRFDEEAESKIRNFAVNVKHTLSKLPNARTPNIRIGRTIYNCLITREEFEKATSELLQSTMRIVDNLKNKCGYKIDHIVCVGGSSNMPQVKAAFEKKYQYIDIKLFEPEKAIAFGAAIYAENFKQKNFLRDICKFSYGARYIENFSKYKDEKRLRIYNILYKDAPLPAVGKSSSFKISDSESSTYIAIYESECTDEMYLPENGTYIGNICIENLKGSKKGDETLLTMTIDRNNIMHLKAVDKRTQKFAEVDLELEDF